MKVIKKGNVEMVARDRNQLAAFLNNGWIVVDTQKENKKVPVETKTENLEETDTEMRKTAKKKYTKSEISRMSTADLKALAPTIGIEVTEETTGAKLKEEITAKLEL